MKSQTNYKANKNLEQQYLEIDRRTNKQKQKCEVAFMIPLSPIRYEVSPVPTYERKMEEN